MAVAMEGKSRFTFRNIVVSAMALIAIIFVLIFSGRIFENVKADEIVIIQDPIDGDLHVYTTPGMKYQNFGKATHYKKAFQYWFTKAEDQGEERDQSIKVRFNDGGHANISGSVRCELPLDIDNMVQLHTKFGSQHAIEQELVRTIFEKAVYMSGPLMSSKESYAEKRNQLISFIEDQALRGVYKTRTRDEKTKDPITGAEKTVTLVEIIVDPAGPGGYARQEESPLQTFGVRAYNLSINDMTYDETVEKQIASQQKAIMEVQTAMAEAKKAEQKAITIGKEGEAEAARQKWEQEAIKAKKIVQAQQEKEIAVINAKQRVDVAEQAKLEAEQKKLAAAEYKQDQIWRGEGDAENKRLKMAADGALEQKLDAYKFVMAKFAEEFGKQKWVPEVQMGSSDATGGNAAANLINLLTATTLKDLGLDMRVPAGRNSNN